MESTSIIVPSMRKKPAYGCLMASRAARKHLKGVHEHGDQIDSNGWQTDLTNEGRYVKSQLPWTLLVARDGPIAIPKVFARVDHVRKRSYNRWSHHSVNCDFGRSF